MVRTASTGARSGRRRQPRSGGHSGSRRGGCFCRRWRGGWAMAAALGASSRLQTSARPGFYPVALLWNRVTIPIGTGTRRDCHANGRADIRRPPHRSGRCGGPPCARPGPGGGPRPARTRSRAGRNPDAAQQMEGRPSLGRVKTPGR